MSLPSRALALSLAAAPFLVACGTHTTTTATAAKQQQVPEEMAMLVPEDAVACVLVPSIDELELALLDASTALGADPPDDLRSAIAPADPEQVDWSRPLGIAMVLPEGSFTPELVHLIPAGDTAALMASLETSPGMAEPRAEGAYVALPMTHSYTPGGRAHPLGAPMLDGELAVRVDLKTVIERFRPMIDQGLEMMPAMVAMAQTEEMPGFDMEAILDFYVQSIRALIDSADTLELALHQDGSYSKIASQMSVLEGSPMAKLGGRTDADLRDVAGALPFQGSMTAYMEMDAAQMMEDFRPLMDTLLGAYPEPLQGTFKEMMRIYDDVLPLVGNAFAMSGDLSDDGMQFAYFFEADDPEQLISTMVEAMSAETLESAGISYGAPEQSTIEGVEVTGLTMDFDWSAMVDMVSEGQESTLSAEERSEVKEQMQELMEAMYGKDGIRMRLAAHEDRVAMLFGGDDAFAKSALSGLGGASTPIHADLEEGLEKVDAAGCGVVIRYDFGEIMNQMSGLMDDWMQGFGSIGAEERPIPELPSIPILWFATVEGTLWTSQVEFDLAGMRQFADAMAGG